MLSLSAGFGGQLDESLDDFGDFFFVNYFCKVSPSDYDGTPLLSCCSA